MAESVVFLGKCLILLGQLLQLGLIFLGDLLDIGDHILPVEAAEHTSSEICTHRCPPFFLPISQKPQEIIVFIPYHSTNLTI